MRRFAVSLLILTEVSASPVRVVQTTNGSVCLGVLLTLFSSLSLLTVFKHIFMKNRRAKAFSSGQYPQAFTFESSLRSSTSILPPSVSICGAGGGKEGFLVGFFGSPTWETRPKAATENQLWKARQNFSFMCQMHTTRRIKSSTEKTLVANVKQSRSISVSTTDVRELYEIRDATGSGQRQSRSLLLPSRPSRVHDSNTRRFSLPSVSRKDIIHASSRKTASSLKSTRNSRRSDASASSILGDPSLRLVQSVNGPDLPLPLSPNPRWSPTAQSPEETKSFSPEDPISYIPPLPPLPVISRTQWDELSQEGSPQLSNPVLRISHPYVLSANSKSLVFPSLDLSARNQGPHFKVLQATSNYIRPLNPVFSPKSALQSPNPQEIPTQDTSVNLGPAPSRPSSPIFPSRSSSPCPPSITAHKIRQKLAPSVRIRRSPAVGPSPLRTMILPDPSEASIVSNADEKENKVTQRNSPQNPGARFGLGLATSYTDLSAVGCDKNEKKITPQTTRDRKSRRHSGASRQEEDDPNILLGIIRELVEETSDWDANLFMDQNFKTLVQGSGISSIRREALADSKFVQNGVTSDLSTEMDLGLLGLDIFKSDGKTFIPPTEEPKGMAYADEMDLVSFWDDRGWANSQDKRGSVGLAL